MPEGAPAGLTTAPWILLALALVGAAMLGTLSALLERSGPIRLRQWAEDAGGRILRVFEDPPRFEAFRFLVNLSARLGLLLVLVALLHAGRSLEHRVAIALAATMIFAVALEWFNRGLVIRRAEPALAAGTWLYRGLTLFLGLPSMALGLVRPFRADEPSDPDDDDAQEASEEEIEAFLDVGTKEGILQADDAEMVRGIVDFGETLVRSVMTPRIDVVGVPADESLQEAALRFSTSKHTRLPVYVDSVDEIAGMLHVLDVLEGLRTGSPAPLSTWVKPALVVPETKFLNELLREFQASGQQVAIVVNEHGSTSGLVTIEDLLEEIVGEIGDEYERPQRDKESLPGGAWRLEGGAHVETLRDLFGVSMDDEPPFETVGGLVISVLGDVPREGDVAEAFGLRFLVERLDGRRVDRLRVERLSAEERA